MTRTESALVVGLDPDLSRMPSRITTDHARLRTRDAAAAAILSFNEQVLDAITPFACAVKPQIAFYERFGPPGLECYERTVALAHGRGLLVIGDIKRGDIGSTAQAYADGHLGSESRHADAITVNPYLGSDSVRPFLAAVREHGSGLFVLVRTSNPSAAELQDQTLREGHPLHEQVAALVERWGNESRGTSGYSSVGAVVGATAPERLARLRELLPHAWLLLPGVGAQGASADDVRAAFDGSGLGAVINSSRAILYAAPDKDAADWARHVAAAARDTRDALRSAASRASRAT
ncbi:MAG: orotidine-5'-phosphate decarboxylase [Planctomycetes bacterium]|nr:orotidine-5'-phosphate decarboxylase [Planctomycetota bacterium]